MAFIWLSGNNQKLEDFAYKIFLKTKCCSNFIKNKKFFFIHIANKTVFQDSLLVLKIYNIRNINYRFLVLAVNFGNTA